MGSVVISLNEWKKFTVWKWHKLQTLAISSNIFIQGIKNLMMNVVSHCQNVKLHN